MSFFPTDSFPIKPVPQEDELFSSWFSRLALAHGLTGHMLAELMWGDSIGANKLDFDRVFKTNIFEELSRKTGIRTESIINTSLFSYTGSLYSELPQTFGSVPWIIPFQNKINKKRYGLQFCGECLKEDINPYFRRKWRLSFIVTCTKHKTVLNNQCPGCSEPVSYFCRSQNQEILPIYICRCCGFDLRETVSSPHNEPPSSFEIKFQEELEHSLESGWIENQAGSMYSPLYFDGIYLIMRSLCGKSAMRFCKAVAEFYEIGNLPVDLFKSFKSLEMRSIHERRSLNILVSHIITNWHHDFVKICEDNKVRSKELISFNPGYFPFWYWKVVEEHIWRPYYSCSELEISSFHKYVKAQGKALNTVKIRNQFGAMYYRHLIIKRKLVSYKNSEKRKCIYCQDTENQKRASTSIKRPKNNFRYYCKICKKAYTPVPMNRKLRHSLRVRKKALELKNKGLSYYKISKVIPVSAPTIRKWYKDSLLG